MSGINGIYERRGRTFPEAAFYLSLEALAGYGLGGGTSWLSQKVGFGHRKMPLAPEESGDVLPLRDAESRLVVTCDARIDNRAELCETFGIAQNERKEIPDSLLILRAFQKWGRDCPVHLIGDYAFAIWDEPAQTLFCARDHIGAKPFYYSLSPERFIFASDLKGLLAVPEVSDRLDEDFVKASIADKRFYLKDRTYFVAIRRLAPGSALTVKAETECLEQNWFPERIKQVRFAKDEDYAEKAKEIFTRAVADRLRTQEKVGVHLSGGLDSSSVAVFAARERRRQGLTPPEAFSWQPPPEDDSDMAREHAQIEAVGEQENLTVHYCPMNPCDILAILKKDPTREPIHITMPIENTIQQAASSKGVRLLLSGWGGDEVLSFNGRGYYSNLLWRGHLLRLFRERPQIGSPIRFMAEEALLLLFPDRNEGSKKLRMRSLKAGTLSNSFIRSELKNGIKLHKHSCRQTSIRSTMLWLWTRGMLTERMESWAAHGAPLKIQYAYPMLDRRLMEFVIALPPEQFVRGKWKRWIMRKTMDGILPAKVCWQPDKREPIRVEKGITAIYEAFDLARQQITAANGQLSRAHYFDMNRLTAYLQPEHLSQRPKHADMLRALQFLDF